MATKLYYAPGTCALASHIALEEAGAAYETVRLSFKNEDQKKPDYLKINPLDAEIREALLRVLADVIGWIRVGDRVLRLGRPAHVLRRDLRRDDRACVWSRAERLSDNEIWSGRSRPKLPAHADYPVYPNGH